MMRMILAMAAIFSIQLYADAFSEAKPKLTPEKAQSKPAAKKKTLKNIDVIAHPSTFRDKAEPIIKPMKKLDPVQTKPDKNESEMDDIRIKKMKPIKLDEKTKPKTIQDLQDTPPQNAEESD